MMRRLAYRAALRLLPAGPAALRSVGRQLPDEAAEALQSILRRHRARSAELRLFRLDEPAMDLLYQGGGAPLPPDCSFRLASISKMVTAIAVMKLREQGLIDIDRDLGEVLPFPLRHPAASEKPITLRMLMSHTAGLRDGAAYTAALAGGVPAGRVLEGDSYRQVPPGHSWHYSNLGAGLVASALEAQLQEPFDDIMRRTLFEPLGIAASFYPQRVKGELVPAFRVLPPARRPAFDPALRRSRPLAGADRPQPEMHYLLSQGSCCMTAAGLQAVLGALLRPGYLNEASIGEMLRPVAPFGARAPKLNQGLGIFRLDDGQISSRPLFGHQGNAYGAIHAAFFEPLSARGLIFLSTGASLSRGDFLCDVVEDLLRWGFSEAPWRAIS